MPNFQKLESPTFSSGALVSMFFGCIYSQTILHGELVSGSAAHNLGPEARVGFSVSSAAS